MNIALGPDIKHPTETRFKTRKLFLIFVFFISLLPLHAQQITGDWYGNLDLGAMQLRLVFHIHQADSGYTATMDSPDQGATGLPVSKVAYADRQLRLDVTNLAIVYEGTFQADSIAGTFRQAGQEFPLNLTRQPVEKKAMVRPQEPVPPFPYYSEEVSFPNPQFDITLAGTLTLPDTNGQYPVAVLISGSGPQDRDEELMGHKPFLVLADYLTRNGIGVLRYDDRGVGQSTGDHAAATSEDLATDVESAVAYLKTRKEIDDQKIGLIGHSEGGLIAPMVAAESDDVSFIVLLAGPGIRGDSIILIQQALISRAGGMTDGAIDSVRQINSRIFELVQESSDTAQLRSELSRFLTESVANGAIPGMPEGIAPEDFVRTSVNSFMSPWTLFFLQYDPVPALQKVDCPVLAINGSNDLQVTPRENLTAIAAALEQGGNTQVTTIEMPGLNHLFQESETGAPVEYAAIEQTFSPDALKVILEWIEAQL